MAFKYKPCKMKFSQECKTLDEIHSATIQKFDDVSKIITKLQKKINSLNKKIDIIKESYYNNNDDNDDNNYDNNNYNDDINNITKKINQLKSDIRELENSNDELDYFDRTKDILIQYYENKSKENSSEVPDEIELNISDDNNTDSQIKSEITDDTEEIDDIMDRFRKLNEMSNKEAKIKTQSKKRRVRTMPEKRSILSFLSMDPSGNSNNDSIKQVIHEKGTLKDQYLCLTDSSYVCDKVKMSPIKQCKNCSNELTLMQSEGYFVCQNCSQAEYVVIESEIPSHKDAMNEKPKYPYNPINHLIEKLNQFQAKQTTIIPPAIYDIVRNEMKKRLINVDDITPDVILKILKKHRKDMFYEHHFLIFSYITNTPPPSLTRDEEEDVKKMFKLTEIAYKIFKPDNRDNNQNYSYVLNKLFLIKAVLDNNQKMANNARYFKLLKSRDKLKMHDAIWKKICNYNNWPFHSSF
jgi:hypothetical protein